MPLQSVAVAVESRAVPPAMMHGAIKGVPQGAAGDDLSQYQQGNFN